MHIHYENVLVDEIIAQDDLLDRYKTFSILNEVVLSKPACSKRNLIKDSLANILL